MPSDILIIPNRNSTTAAPVMQFSGSQGNSIRLEVLTSGSVAFLGKSGSLFSISDSFSGSLMAVGDISGLPILEVFSDDRVVMGKFNSNALVVTGSNVGVGMASPAYSLDISGSANISKAGTVQFNINSTSNGSKEIIFRDGGSIVGYLWNVSGYMAIGGGSTTNSMFVTTSNGNVGIRKANPIVPLDVSGSVFISGSTSITGSLTVSVPSGTAASFLTPNGGVVSFTNGLIDSTYSQFGFKAGAGVAAYIGANNSQHLTVTTAGNVAIGKTTANTTLDVNGNVAITGSAEIQASISGYYFHQLKLKSLNSNFSAGMYLTVNNGSRTYIEAHGNGVAGSMMGVTKASKNFIYTNPGDLVIGTNSGDAIYFSTGSVAAIISTAGNVGIGTTSPNVKLEVVGNTIITGSLTVTDGIQFKGVGSDILHPFLFITFF